MSNNRKKIIIQYDSSCEKCVSYVQVLEQISKSNALIHTNCLDFFSFTYLDKGYDVIVQKANGDYIILSELLCDAANQYTNKEIRKAHNVRKLLIANKFKFKNKNRS